MSNLKITENLFLGKQELNRLVRFLVDDGYKKYGEGFISKYGIYNDKAQDPTFSNLNIRQGSAADMISVDSGFAINDNKDTLSTDTVEDILTSPTDDTFRYVIASYAETVIEVGTVDIAASGQLTGTGTLFTEVLRGQPNFAATIKFPNSGVNTGEYDVISVANDTDAIISGNLVVEVGAEYVIVGTFTPDKIIPAPNKEIFIYDSISLTLEATDTSVVGTSFALARVKSDGAVMTIEDIRSDFLETKGSLLLGDYETTASALAGIEWIKYDTVNSDKSSNIVKMGWGFVGTSWTFNSSTGVVTINTGTGGVFDDVSDMTTGDFDGWRVYLKTTGETADVVSSIGAGGSVELTMRNLNYDIFNAAAGDDIIVVPNADMIEVFFTPFFSANDNAMSQHVFPVVNGFGEFRIKSQGKGHLSYRYINNKKASAIFAINTGDYLSEASFTDDGFGSSTVLASVTGGGTFTPLIHADNFYTKKAWLDQENTFTEVNNFAKMVTQKNGGGLDIFETVNGSDVIDITDAGNIFTVTDTGGENGLDGMLTTGITNSPIIIIENVRASSTPITLRHDNVVAADVTAGYAPFELQGLNIDLAQNDKASFALYNGSWNLVSLFRENAWQLITLNGGDISGADWTLNSGTIQYQEVGSTIHMNVRLDLTTGASPSALVEVAIPWSAARLVTVTMANSAALAFSRAVLAEASPAIGANIFRVGQFGGVAAATSYLLLFDFTIPLN